MIMKLQDVRDLFELINTKENLEFSEVYLGYLEDKKDNSLGVYEPNQNENEIFLGGYENSRYKTINITLLVHGTKDFIDTEDKAFALFDVIEKLQGGVETEDFSIYSIRTMENRPINVGIDKNYIHEYVINLQIIYFIKGGN